VESVLDDQPVIEALRSSSTAPTDDVLAHASPAQLQDVAVSDLESDLEPDELVPMYLKIKSKLFEVDPDVLETKLRKATKGRIPKEAGSENAPTVRKLLSQLQRLESDPFFDRDQAETQWPSKRNELAQAKAATKIPTGLGSLSQAARVEFPTVANDSLSAHQYDSPDAHSEDEETDLLGEMFAAVPDPSPTASTSRDAASEKTTLRDFGKQSGLSPRRLLEEAIRGRLVAIFGKISDSNTDRLVQRFQRTIGIQACLSYHVLEPTFTDSGLV
jgi:ATP-dependent RNA helicase DHX29